MMNHLLPGVDALVELEHKTIVDKYGEGYHSDHEGYAVLQEEIEEAQERLDIVKTWHERMWACIREDGEVTEDKLERVEYNAKQLAAEAVQIAAVARRWRGVAEG
jgi:hypothetical protein